MTFTKLNPDHYIYKTNKLLVATDVVYQIEITLGKALFFWVHGDGVIPLHTKPDLAAEIDYRIALKIHVFGAELMEYRLQPTKYKS